MCRNLLIPDRENWEQSGCVSYWPGQRQRDRRNSFAAPLLLHHLRSKNFMNKYEMKNIPAVIIAMCHECLTYTFELSIVPSFAPDAPGPSIVNIRPTASTPGTGDISGRTFRPFAVATPALAPSRATSPNYLSQRASIESRLPTLKAKPFLL
jgi:hypothetical protein